MFREAWWLLGKLHEWNVKVYESEAVVCRWKILENSAILTGKHVCCSFLLSLQLS